MSAFLPLPPPPASPALLHEVFAQPEVLRRVLAETRVEIESFLASRSAPARRVHFTGCGDMHFAARAAAWQGRLLGMDAHAHPAMDLRWLAPRLESCDLVVCASVSGRTPRTIEAARLARSRGAQVLAITDDPGAPLAASADGVAGLRTSPPASLSRGAYPGYQYQVPQTKTFTAALLAELCVLRVLLGERESEFAALDSLPAELETWLPDLSTDAAALAAPRLRGKESILVTAGGPFLPVAEYAAAKLLEYAIPAGARCIEESNHLDVFVAGASTLYVALAPDFASSSRLAELVAPWAALGVETLAIGPPQRAERETHWPLPDLPVALAPFALAAATQLLAYEAARAFGRDPERWLGGARTLVQNFTSARTVRASRIDPRPSDVTGEGNA